MSIFKYRKKNSDVESIIETDNSAIELLQFNLICSQYQITLIFLSFILFAAR